MADIVLIDLAASYDKFKTATKSAVTELNKVDTAAKKAGTDTTKAFDTAAGSVTKFNKTVDTSSGKVNTGINNLNQTASKTGGAFSGASKIASNGLNGLATQLSHIGGAMVGAFAVHSVIEFGVESAKAFMDAEKNSQLLLFALKGNVSAQSELIGLSEELQNKTIFSDDSIQQAETFLALEGRTPEQIEKVIRAATELSTVTGQDLQTAVMNVNGTFEGSIGKLGKLDHAFKTLTPKQLENGAAVDLLLKKYGGLAEEMGTTSAGKVERLRNQFDDFKEDIGSKIVPELSVLFDAWQSFGQIKEQGLFSRGGLQGVKGGLLSLFQGINHESDMIGALFGVSQKIVDNTTQYELRRLKVVAATDKEVAAQVQLLKAQGLNTAEFEKYAASVKQSAIDQTFDELAQALEIDIKQYERLVAISDKYGISARINSSLILDGRQDVIDMNDKTKTSEDRLVNKQNLDNAYQKFNKTLGVTRKDFNDYLGILEDIPPATDIAAKSTAKAVSPYDQLSQAVQKSFKALQDLSALALKGLALSKLGDQTDNVKEAQFRLALANNLVTISMGDYKKELEDLSSFMNSNGKFIFTIPGGEEQQARILEMINGFKEVQAAEKELAARDIETKAHDEQEKIRIKQESEEIQKDLLARKMANEQEAQSFLTNLGIRGVQSYADRFQELEDLRKADLIGNQEYMDALTVLTTQQFAATSNALGDLAGNLSTTLSAIFGDAAKKNATFASFVQTLTITEILFKQGAAIANSIEKITTAVDPFSVIAGIAGIIASIGSIFSGVLGTIQNTQIPAPPKFATGTDYVQRGNNPMGIDKIPAWLNEGEGIATSKANKKNPGVIKAMNEGNFDAFIYDKFITPHLQKKEKEMKTSFAENISNLLGIQVGDTFNDYRLRRAIEDGNNITKYGFEHLIGAVKSKQKRRGGNA